MATAYIGLGSNLGDRAAEIEAALSALRELDGVNVAATSPSYETASEGPVEQGRYLNAAAAIETRLGPRELLDAMLAIERTLGRRREQEIRWGPRRIDLDLLMYDDRILDEPGLTIPHPRMHQRRFVLGPLSRIAPDAVHPQLDETIEFLLDRLGPASPAEYGRPAPGSK